MSSFVHYKFKSWKDPQRITFDGTGITVFELKREIINVSGLGDGTDFDLGLYSPEDNEEYKDDTEIVSRFSLVVARRLPASRPGFGKAARYVSGKAPVTAKNSYRAEQPTSKLGDGSGKSTQGGVAAMEKAQTEEEKIAAMFQAGGDAWEQQQQQMANAKPVYRPGNRKPTNVPEHEPPPGYVCYRCQEKGHWIQACPTNDDPNFEKRPRIKRTTGIPRTFLQKVEKPEALKNDGLTDDRKQQNVLMDAEGEYVVVKPDEKTWEKFQEKTKASAAQQVAANAENKILEERGLLCPINKQIYENPMKTDCCGTTYCNDCIENALINSDLVCPNCGTEGVLIDNLAPDEAMRSKIAAYEEEKLATKTKLEGRKDRANSHSSNASDASKGKENPEDKPQALEKNSETTSYNADGVESKGSPKEGSKSPVAQSKSQTNTPNSTKAVPVQNGEGDNKSKKRSAENELPNTRVPSAPAAMRGQQGANVQPNVNGPAGFDQAFIEQMNALAPQQNLANGNGFGGPGMPGMGYPNQNGMNGGMGMPGMGHGMENPMMMQQFQQFQQNPLFGMGGMMGMNGMNGMHGMNAMGNMNGMNGNGMYQQYGGFNNQQIMPNGYGPQQWQQQQGGNGWGMQGWQNQNGNQQFQNFPQQQNEDDGAYMRKPVNPHRHAFRNKRVRPSDYREL